MLDRMRLKIKTGLLCFAILLITVQSIAGEADSKAIANYELSLFGYTLGMTHDEATEVRPFEYLKSADRSRLEQAYYGMVDKVYIEELPISLQIFFAEEQLQKIVGRFRPEDIDLLLPIFQKAFGPGENRSKEVTRANGVLVKHTSYRWNFPGARIILFVTTAHDEFGTASLFRYSEPIPEETEEKP